MILDRKRDVVLEVLDDRKAETLEQWLRDRPVHHLESVQTVTMDMWDPFIRAVKTCISGCEGEDLFRSLSCSAALRQGFGQGTCAGAASTVGCGEHKPFDGNQIRMAEKRLPSGQPLTQGFHDLVTYESQDSPGLEDKGSRCRTLGFPLSRCSAQGLERVVELDFTLPFGASTESRQDDTQISSRRS